MRGSRKPRGLVHRAGKIAGVNYTGDPTGAVAPWGGGDAGVSTPALGQYPVVTIPIDDDDDGTDKPPQTMQSHDGRRVADDTTKSRFRTQLKTLANWIAKLSQKATGTDSDFVFSDDFVGASIDASKWTVTGTSADATITHDAPNGGMGVVELNPTVNGDGVSLDTRALAVGTKDFICAMRFRFGAAMDSTKASFILGLYGGFWLESNAATSAIYLRYDGGGVFPANTYDTGLLVSDTTYHVVQIKRLGGTLHLVVDGVTIVSFADTWDAGGGPVLHASALDTTAPADLLVDYIKAWVAR